MYVAGLWTDNRGHVTLDAMVIDEFTRMPDAARERQQRECEYLFDCARYEQTFQRGGERDRYLLMFVGPWDAGSPGSLVAAQTRFIL